MFGGKARTVRATTSERPTDTHLQVGAAPSSRPPEPHDRRARTFTIFGSADTGAAAYGGFGGVGPAPSPHWFV